MRASEDGGTGRRTRLRIWRRKAWGFDSPSSHDEHRFLMTELAVYRWLAFGFIALGASIFIYLQTRVAPYGRHSKGNEGPTVSTRTGWFVMEAPAALLVPVYFLLHPPPAMAWIYLALWELHYAYRAFVFPFRMRGSDRPMPLLVVGSGFAFNVANSYLIGRGFTLESPEISPFRLLLGGAIFLFGMAINRRSDRILFDLRGPGETGYKIPVGGLFRWISCPNYAGEIIEWIGFAIAMPTWGAAAFAFWTFANLAPRARAHHRWYRDNFLDYPKERRALIPYLW